MAPAAATGYVREVVHFHHPVCPLFADLVLPAINHGVNAALDHWHAPVARVELVVRDDHVYTAWPLELRGDDGQEADAHQTDLGEIVPQWEGEVEHVERLVEAITTLFHRDDRLDEDLVRLPRLLHEVYEVHYRVAHGVLVGHHQLSGTLAAAGADHPQAVAGQLLTGSEGRLGEIDRWLGELSTALATSDADEHLQHADAEGLVAALAEDDGLLGELFDRGWPHVRARPHRADLAAPTWGEDPSPLVRALHAAGHARADAGAARRDAAEEHARRLLDAPAGGWFDDALALLRRSRAAGRTINHLASSVVVGETRLAALRLGGHLADDGLLPSAEAAVWATMDELAAALAGDPPAGEVLVARRARVASAATHPPPDVVGDVAPEAFDDPRWAGLLGARRPGRGANTWKGVAASPGKATGPARVVTADAGLGSLRPGDVLVVTSLPPAWTPAAAKAAAVVTATGGLLSHAAIVAREWGIPAVVGVAGIVDEVVADAELEVDGDTGTVSLAKKS